jgi:SAM-dependent methyltransferase
MKASELVARAGSRDWMAPFIRTGSRAATWFRPFLLHVDIPAYGVLRGTVETVQGWFLAPAEAQGLSLQVAGVPLTWVEVERPDAKKIFGPNVRGFRAILDSRAINRAGTIGDSSEAELALIHNGKTVAVNRLRLPPWNENDTTYAAEVRARKREWLKAHLICPHCRTNGKLEFCGDYVRCPSCSASYPDNGSVFNFLPENLRRECEISDWTNISGHPYDETARDVIASVSRQGGKVLDCGSGLRPRPEESVVCLEIEAFPNVDVLGVNQSLPFQDSCFDAVLSLNVLEHVSDPLSCAAELARVLKPGGTLYCCIPFLQPEHGYPDHYFNATRSGLRRLFSQHLELAAQFLPRAGEPVFTLHWILSWYADQLPAGERRNFLDMRVSELLAESPERLLDKPWVTNLSEEGKWRLACSTAALWKKPFA